MADRSERLEMLRTRIERLSAQKRNLLALMAIENLSTEARAEFGRKLDLVLSTLRKYSIERDDLEREP